jgi:hypothetical protein
MNFKEESLRSVTETEYRSNKKDPAINLECRVFLDFVVD